MTSAVLSSPKLPWSSRMFTGNTMGAEEGSEDYKVAIVGAREWGHWLLAEVFCVSPFL